MSDHDDWRESPYDTERRKAAQPRKRCDPEEQTWGDEVGSEEQPDGE